MSASDGLLSNRPIKAILIRATGLDAGGHLVARVGLKSSSWEDRGSNDGAVSEDAPPSGQIALGWLVYNTFRRDPDQLELLIRVMTKNHRLVGKEIMGQVKVDLKHNVNQQQVQVLGVQLTITIGVEAIFNDTGITPVPRCHPCGTNHFGMLPEGISELSLKNCTIWGSAHIPMTSWVTCHFLYKDHPFQHGPILVKSPTNIPKVKDYKGDPVKASPSGAKAGYGVAQAPDKIISNAVPMLEVAQPDGIRVIADGVMINYLTIPLLYSQPITPHVLRWERIIGYELIPALWRESSGLDHARTFARTCPNYPPTFTSAKSPLLRKPVAAMTRNMQREMNILKDYIGQEFDSTGATTMKSIFQQFKSEMIQQMGKQDFMGGEKPNPTDVSFYGFNVVRFVTQVGSTRALMEETGLLPWMYRMMDILPPTKCLAMEYFGPAMEGWKGGWMLEKPKPDPVKVPIEYF